MLTQAYAHIHVFLRWAVNWFVAHLSWKVTGATFWVWPNAIPDANKNHSVEIILLPKELMILLCKLFDASILKMVAGWLGSRIVACWTRAQKGPGSNRSRDAVG